MTTWSAERRRASIQNHLSPAVSDAELRNFLAVEADCDPEDFTINVNGWTIGIYADTITEDQLAAAEGAARKVMPAHASWELSRTPPLQSGAMVQDAVDSTASAQVFDVVELTPTRVLIAANTHRPSAGLYGVALRVAHIDAVTGDITFPAPATTLFTYAVSNDRHRGRFDMVKMSAGKVLFVYGGASTGANVGMFGRMLTVDPDTGAIDASAAVNNFVATTVWRTDDEGQRGLVRIDDTHALVTWSDEAAATTPDTQRIAVLTVGVADALTLGATVTFATAQPGIYGSQPCAELVRITATVYMALWYNYADGIGSQPIHLKAQLFSVAGDVVTSQGLKGPWAIGTPGYLLGGIGYPGSRAMAIGNNRVLVSTFKSEVSPPQPNPQRYGDWLQVLEVDPIGYTVTEKGQLGGYRLNPTEDIDREFTSMAMLDNDQAVITVVNFDYPTEPWSALDYAIVTIDPANGDLTIGDLKTGILGDFWENLLVSLDGDRVLAVANDYDPPYGLSMVEIRRTGS